MKIKFASIIQIYSSNTKSNKLQKIESVNLQFIKIVFAILVLVFSLNATAQNQDQKQKTPIEIASEQAGRLQRDLKLNDYQVFKADSILQRNITGVVNQFEEMKKGGLQNPDSYREVQKMWQAKTDSAFESLFTLEQFDRYLKISGMSNKERKKKIAEVKKRAQEEQKSK